MIGIERANRLYAACSRYRQLMELLPDLRELDPANAGEMAELEMICAELDKTGAQIDELMRRLH
jgi:hypothetical protein